MTIDVTYSLVAGLGPGIVVLRFLLWKKQQQRPEILIDFGVVGDLDIITLCKHIIINVQKDHSLVLSFIWENYYFTYEYIST